MNYEDYCTKRLWNEQEVERLEAEIEDCEDEIGNLEDEIAKLEDDLNAKEQVLKATKHELSIANREQSALISNGELEEFKTRYAKEADEAQRQLQYIKKRYGRDNAQSISDFWQGAK